VKHELKLGLKAAQSGRLHRDEARQSNRDPGRYISTSYVERQNLTMRMHMRRFTRPTNGFSKNLANHIAAVSLHFMFYKFVRIHQTLRVTPAMAAGVTDRRHCEAARRAGRAFSC
jgi:hypothetical protein